MSTATAPTAPAPATARAMTTTVKRALRAAGAEARTVRSDGPSGWDGGATYVFPVAYADLIKIADALAGLPAVVHVHDSFVWIGWGKTPTADEAPAEDATSPAPTVQPALIPVGSRVWTREGTGTVVAPTVWTWNLEHGTDPGDRTVRMDVTGERLVFEGYLMRVVELPASPTDSQYARYSTADLVGMREELEVLAQFHEEGAEEELATVRATLAARGLCPQCVAPTAEGHAWNCPADDDER